MTSLAELPPDFQGFFEASPNPYLVLDRRLHIAGANRAYLVGVKRELNDIIGRWAWDAFPTDPVTLKQAIASFERVIATKQPDTMALLRFDVPRPEADGGGMEERYWSITHAPVLDAAGEVAFVLQHPIDVTELQRLRLAAQQHEDLAALDLRPAHIGIFSRAQTVYETNLALEQKVQERTTERDRLWSMPSLLLAIAAFDSTIVAVNPGWPALLGWSQDEMVGRSYAEFIHPDDVQRSLDWATRLAAGEEVEDLVNLYRCKDGSFRSIAWTITRGDGMFHCVGRDVTAELEQAASLRQAEEALRQSQKMEVVGQLTGGVAHDFNNLLTVIKSSTDLLKRPDLAEDRRARYVAAISDTVDRAAKLTGQLLAFARRQALKPAVFAACDSVRALAEMIGTLTGSRIKIVTELPKQTCFVNADPSQFDTALVNMAVNARDAMDGEGQLIIRVSAVQQMPAVRAHTAINGNFVAVEVSDTGSGISSEQLERIFEPFFTTKAVGQGTGLGLSQVFGFAKQSGGEITVESEVGRGTTFTLYLPRVAAAASITAESEPEPLMDGHGTCVLVVEDNVEVGTFAVQTLTDLGYVPVLASNADEALAELAKDADRFDVVFSDVVMPGMNGIEMGQEIRRLYHDMPVLLASGYSHVLAQNGTYGFELLHKPYSVEQLSRLLRKVATWQRRKRIMRR